MTVKELKEALSNVPDDGDYYNQTICEKFQCTIGIFKKSDKKFER